MLARQDRSQLFDFFGPEGFNTEKLTAWVNENAFPALAEISPTNYALFEERKLPFAWVFLKGHGSSSPDGARARRPAPPGGSSRSQARARAPAGETPQANTPEVDAANKAILVRRPPSAALQAPLADASGPAGLGQEDRVQAGDAPRADHRVAQRRGLRRARAAAGRRHREAPRPRARGRRSESHARMLAPAMLDAHG